MNPSTNLVVGKQTTKLVITISRYKPQKSRPSIATDESVLPSTKSYIVSTQLQLRRQARILQKGVWILNTTAFLKCELNIPTSFVSKSHSKLVGSLSNSVTETSSDQTLWSMSKQLSAKQETKATSRTFKGLIQTTNPMYLDMFTISRG